MIMKRKNIQIPTDLFLNLCNYHLAGIRSPEQDQRIQQGLQNKLDAVKRRSDYHQKRDAYDKIALIDAHLAELDENGEIE